MVNLSECFPALHAPVRISALAAIVFGGGLFGACTGTATSRTCTSTGGATLTVTGGETLPKAATVYPVNNAVDGMTGTITSVRVVLNGLTHTDPDDLDMVLRAPDGRTFVFWSDIGGVRGTSNACPTSPYACSISNFTITVADSGATLLPDGNGATGQDARVLVNNTTYKPTNNGPANADSFPNSGGIVVTAANSAPNWPTVTGQGGTASFTSIFGGSSNVNGTWSLFIVMDSCCGPGGTDTGSLTSWSLIVTTDVGTVNTTTSLTRTPNNSTFVGDPVTFTAAVSSGAGLFGAIRAVPVTLGSVTFKEGATVLAGPVTVDGSGLASFTTSALTESAHTILAEYSGATGFGPSSATIQHTVNRQTVVTGNKFCNPGTLTVPNVINGPGTPYPSNLFVTGLAGTSQKITMDLLSFTHPVPDDVDLLLVSPTGQKYVPFASVAGVTPVANINLTLDDAAASLMPSTGSFPGGTYRPSAFASPAFVAPAPSGPYQLAATAGSATFISTFAGAAPNGTWQLYAISHGAGTAGTRQFAGGWCLTFTTSSDPATVTVPSVTPTPSAVNQSVTVAALVSNATTSAPVNGLGTVNFAEGNTALAGPLNLGSNGVASFTKSDFTQGAHFLTANYNGSPGNFGVSNGTVLHYVDAATSGTSPQFCNTSSVTFPNTINASGSPYPTRTLVSGLAGTVQRVTVSLNGITHQFPDDMDMMLSGPNGNSLILFSDTGGSTAVNGVNITLDDTAASALPDGPTLTSGTFRPFDYQAGVETFAAPAPTTNVFSASNTTLTAAFTNINPNGYWTLYTSNDSSGSAGGGSLAGGWCLTFTMNRPDLSILKSHTGNFTLGQTNAQYSVIVTNNGPGSTQGTVEVTDTPSSGLTVTGMSGSGWTCDVPNRKCTTSASVGAGQAYPAIAVTVSVSVNATSPQQNSVTVAGGGDNTSGNNTSVDSTIISPASDLTVTKTPTGVFVQGGNSGWTLVARNAGAAASFGAITISDNMPTGITIASVAPGSGWDCAASTANFASCTRTASIPANEAAPAITVNVSVASNAPVSITNTVTVAGGGEIDTTNNSASSSVSVEARTPVTIVVPAGVSFSLNGSNYTGTQIILLAPGSYPLSTTTPQALGAGTQAVFVSWSDGGEIAHSVAVGSSPLAITGIFQTQFQLTTVATTGGTIAPSSGSFIAENTTVSVSATPNSGFTFAGFTGDLTGTATPQSLLMNSPKTVTANFSVTVAPNVTGQVTMVTGALTYSRATGRFSQPVTVTNSGAAISSAAIVLDSLASGVTLFQPSGVTAQTSPVGSPYKELGPIGGGATVSFLLEFSRTGTPAITYTPRVLGSGAR